MVKFDFKDLFLFALSYLGLNSILAVLLRLLGTSPDNPIVYLIANLVLGFSIAGVPLLIVKLRYKGSIKETLGIRKDKMWDSVLLALSVFIVYLILLTFIHLVSSNLGTVGSTVYSMQKHTASLSIHACVLALAMAPVIEEIVFRGFLQNILTNKFGGTFGVLMTSILFTLAHVQYYGNITSLVTLGILALLLGTLKHRTASIMPTMALHFLNNLVCCLNLM